MAGMPTVPGSNGGVSATPGAGMIPFNVSSDTAKLAEEIAVFVPDPLVWWHAQDDSSLARLTRCLVVILGDLVM